MKINSIFKRFFKKNTGNKDIVSLNANFPMPTKDSLDEKDLKKLEEYIVRIKNILSFDKTIVSRELDFNQLFEDLHMNAVIITSSFFDDDFKRSLKMSDKVNRKVELLKLKLYEQGLEELKKEVELNYIALKEVLKSKNFFLSIGKRKAVMNALQNLENCIIIYQNQDIAIKLKMASDFNRIGTMEDSYDEEEFEQALELASIFISKKLKAIQSLNLSRDIETATIIRELEIYAYRNRDRIEELEHRLDMVFKGFDNCDDKYFEKELLKLYEYRNRYTKEELDRRLDTIYRYFDICDFKEQREILELEKDFLLFSKYGKDTVDKSFMETFYRVKFYILTQNINIDRTVPDISKMNMFEKSCYKKIIDELIDQILRSMPNRSIEGIKNFLKIDGKFDSEAILQDPLRLAFTVSALDQDKFIEFLTKYKVSTGDYDMDYQFRIFTWEKEIPILTMFKIAELNLEKPKEPLFQLMDLKPLFPKHEDDLYFFPEGLLEVHIPSMMLDSEEQILQRFYKDIENETIVLPKNMTKFEVNHEFPRVLGFNFNDGLKRLVLNFKNEIGVEEIRIPSSVEDICATKDFSKRIKRLYIEDYVNSPLLKENNHTFTYFLRQFLYVWRPSLISQWRTRTHLNRFVLVDSDGRYIDLDINDSNNIVNINVQKGDHMVSDIDVNDIKQVLKMIIDKAQAKKKSIESNHSKI